jgi:ubiquinone/menaquinone biosynthesis C-methylase UbiE
LDDWSRTAKPVLAAATLNASLLRSYGPVEEADQYYAQETLNAQARGPHSREGAEPYSLQWYLDIENQRHSRHGRWLPRLLEFAKHSGETLLGLGNGLGTDWVQYARHGATVVVCSSSAKELALARRNFELRGLGGRFLHASLETIPLENASIDVVCVSSLSPMLSEPGRVAAEIYRVLKPGGKVLAVTQAKYDATFWSRLLLPWRNWIGPDAAARPEGERYSARRLRRLFDRFIEHRIHKRQLRRREVPVGWRLFPLPVLERIMGRVLVLKAFKPLSAAMAASLAA